MALLVKKENVAINVENKKPESYSQRKNLISNIDIEQNQKKLVTSKYFCNKCSMYFKNKWNLKLHLKAIHTLNLNEYFCRQCGSRFKYWH